MKIGIDARPLTVDKFTGIPNYVYQICKQWMKNHPEHEYYLMARRPICFSEEDLPANWHIVNDPWIIDKGKFWFLFKLPRLIKKNELDVFWGPNYTLPRKVNGTKYYLSIMDMAIFKFKHVGQWKNSLQIKLFLKKNTKKAERIIVISESTKKDVVEILNVADGKIDVTYIAGDADDSSLIKNKDVANNFANTKGVRQEFQELEKYFLFVGTIEPRKNIATIVKAFEEFSENNMHENAKLVLAGGRGWNCGDIYSLVEASKYTDRIMMPGFVSDVEKEYLYKNATAFVYPSLYEGFGMPILEAFKFNTPVITANNSSLPEVGGNAVLYIDTFDSSELSKCLTHTLNMTEKDFDDLKTRMKAQLNRFSWEKCADETLRIITEE